MRIRVPRGSVFRPEGNLDLRSKPGFFTTAIEPKQHRRGDCNRFTAAMKVKKMFSAAYHKPSHRRKPAPRTEYRDQQRTRFVLFRCLMTIEYLRRALPYPSWKRNPRAWKYFIGHLRIIWQRQIKRWQQDGTVKPAQAERLRTCNQTGSRWHCDHVACPWCWFRRFLYLSRVLWQEAIEPALHERRAAPRRKKPRTRLVVGVVTVTVDRPAEVGPRFNRLMRTDRVVRKIQRAGGVDDGIACTSVVPLRLGDGHIGYRIRVGVLGLTDRAVQVENPQPPSSVDWRVEWTSGVRKRVPDVPQLGPRVLMNLLAKAFPYPAEFLDCGLPPESFIPALSRSRERVRAFGAWREFIEARPSKFPPPCELPRLKPPIPSAEALRDAHGSVESMLVRLQGCLRVGETLTGALEAGNTRPSFRYAVLSRAGLHEAASLCQDDARNELLRDPALCEAMAALLPGDFVRMLKSESARDEMAAIERNWRFYNWDCGNSVQLAHYVSIQLLKRFGFGPRGIAKMKERLQSERLFPRRVCDELELPILFEASRKYEVELEGAFPKPEELRLHVIDNWEWRPTNARDIATRPCGLVFDGPDLLAQQLQWTTDYFPFDVRFRRKLQDKPAWVAVVFRPAWAKRLQVLHNFEPAEAALPEQILRLRTRGGEPLYLQEFRQLLDVLPSCLQAEMDDTAYEQFMDGCRELAQEGAGVGQS